MEEQLVKALELLKKCYNYLDESGLLEDFNRYVGAAPEEPSEEKEEAPMSVLS